MLIRSIDFETCGVPADKPEIQDELVEIGWQDVVTENPPRLQGEGGRTFADPPRPITPQARGVHHIDPAELADAPDRRSALRMMIERDGIPDFFCAHNAKFERSLWSTEHRPWICTRKAAMRIWPDAPDYKLQTLRYWLILHADPTRAWPPHRAQPDAYVGALLLIECLKHATPHQMAEWSEVPALLPGPFPLKKHKGKTWQQVVVGDRRYLEWVATGDHDLDEDYRFTAKYWLDASKPQRGY